VVSGAWSVYEKNVLQGLDTWRMAVDSHMAWGKDMYVTKETI
jgi:hypothetical protein